MKICGRTLMKKSKKISVNKKLINMNHLGGVVLFMFSLSH